MNTLVYAFVSSVNSRYENSINHYYELGKLLLLSSIPKIIFVDEPMFNLIDNNYEIEDIKDSFKDKDITKALKGYAEEHFQEDDYEEYDEDIDTDDWD